MYHLSVARNPPPQIIKSRSQVPILERSRRVKALLAKAKALPAPPPVLPVAPPATRRSRGRTWTGGLLPREAWYMDHEGTLHPPTSTNTYQGGSSILDLYYLASTIATVVLPCL